MYQSRLKTLISGTRRGLTRLRTGLPGVPLHTKCMPRPSPSPFSNQTFLCSFCYWPAGVLWFGQSARIGTCGGIMKNRRFEPLVKANPSCSCVPCALRGCFRIHMRSGHCALRARECDFHALARAFLLNVKSIFCLCGAPRQALQGRRDVPLYETCGRQRSGAPVLQFTLR